MNLFKTDPKKIFEILVAFLTVVFAYFLVVYFISTDQTNQKPDKPVVPTSIYKGEQAPGVNYGAFGVIHIDVDSPSYAKSNFDVNPLTPITVYFNGDVDLESVVGNFSLRNKLTNEAVPVNIGSRLRNNSDDQNKYNWRWQEVWQQKVILTPSVELEPVTMYEVTISPGFYNTEETKTAAQGMSFEFLTADDPGILNTNIKEEENIFAQGDSIKIVFNSPMNQEELTQQLTVIPSTDWQIVVNDKIMTLDTAGFAPGEYELTIPAETKDIYGRALGESISYVFVISQ